MPDEAQSRLLIVEDDLDVADMLSAYFRVQGFDAVTANWGEDGVKLALNNPPDLVILDIRLPDIDGFEVAQRLRQNRRTAEVPIIFLTEKREREARLKGLGLKADDYVTKPFDIQELRLRVVNILSRVRRSSLNNPVTGTPEGRLVDERLEACLSTSGWMLLLVELQNLSVFREAYGFVAADDLLRAVALMLKDILDKVGNQDDFLGHLNISNFVIITNPDKSAVLQENIIRRLEQSFEYFYRDQDRNIGTFKHFGLGVHIDIITPNPAVQSVEQFKITLESLYRQNIR
jgi:DNA-binding response OmpR family regulator